MENAPHNRPTDTQITYRDLLVEANRKVALLHVNTEAARTRLIAARDSLPEEYRNRFDTCLADLDSALRAVYQ